jgi:hypothetical protein
MTNRETGINVVREMMGDEAAAKLSASAGSNTFGAPIVAYAVDQVFADIWTRTGLDRRSRAQERPHTTERNRGSSHPGAAIHWLSCHRKSTGCCWGYQGAWSGRRRKPPRPALTRSGIKVTVSY